MKEAGLTFDIDDCKDNNEGEINSQDDTDDTEKNAGLNDNDLDNTLDKNT